MELYKENVGGQTNYNIFVPDNVSEDTPVLFYAFNHGFTEKMKDDIIKQNGDVIVIVPENTPVHVGGETANHEYQSEAIEVFNLIKEKYNLETTQFAQAGYSASYGCSIRTSADYIKSNPNAERQILISVDGCESDNGFPIYKSDYEAISQNNPIIISYAQKYRQGHEIRFTGGKTPILFVLDPDIPENSSSNWGRYHNIIPNNFTSRGLYNDLMNFAIGKGELPKGYKYQVYDPSTGLVKDIEPEDAASFLGINTYQNAINKIYSLRELTLEDMSVTSNSEVLLKHINYVINNIKGSSFIHDGITSNLSFNSTTKIPSQITDTAKEYYYITSILMLKLYDEIHEFAKISEQIEEDDRELEQEAIQLNDTMIGATTATQLNTIVTDVSQSTTSDTGNTTENNVNVENQTPTQKPNKTPQTQPELPQKPAEEKQEETNAPETKPIDKPKEEQKPSTPNTNDNSNGNSNNGNNKPTYNNNSSNERLNRINDFPDYKEVYSDESRIVYDYKDEYRIIIHKDGDEIIGIEHYYKFDNENLADQALSVLADKYKFDNNIENIIQKGNYVKVVFKEDVYSNMTLADIKNKYKDLNEIFRI